MNGQKKDIAVTPLRGYVGIFTETAIQAPELELPSFYLGLLQSQPGHDPAQNLACFLAARKDFCFRSLVDGHCAKYS